ncbi:hypothetical protein E2R68_02170 [Psychromonas sp. RZ22]|uniref:oligogalacturonate-specific porin KdgM family protein n=1 Tax=Psychromonas algarum TaxID=2555643 RepID=UPI001067A5D7|nr:oligogalacturonate-specific porin KdgM family protein [Psychromonas sp. RZ22]TEW56857.1 hypothetical protein E2R68_02170 [Psychromonas sp. RZ22]
MKLQNKLIFAVAATVLAGTASAGSFDFRHEWKDKSETQASRVKVGDSWKPFADHKNVSVYGGLEMKFAGQDDSKNDFFGNWALTETELDMGVKYTMGKWYFQPGMPIAMTASRTVYKPQFRVGYKSDFGLKTALRYRFEYRDQIDGVTTTNMDGDALNNYTQGKLTLTGGYGFKSIPGFELSYEANYVQSYDNIRLANNDDWEWDAGVIAGYKMGNWKPYAEVWTVDGTSSKTDERQMRYRLGIKYYY